MGMTRSIQVMMMNIVDRLADARIESAVADGVFDDLPGTGQPLPPDEAVRVPAELRAGYRLLKSAGYAPLEVTQARDIRELRDLLATVEAHSAEAAVARRRLRWLELTLAGSRRGSGLLRHGEYGVRIRQSLAGNS